MSECACICVYVCVHSVCVCVGGCAIVDCDYVQIMSDGKNVCLPVCECVFVCACVFVLLCVYLV